LFFKEDVSSFPVVRRGIIMSQFFRLHVDEEALTDALFEFVIDPHASRNERAVISVLHEVAADMVPVMECMVLDGVDERHYVADYVHAVVSGYALE
jgi:hypothetical protein